MLASISDPGSKVRNLQGSTLPPFVGGKHLFWQVSKSSRFFPVDGVQVFETNQVPGKV